MVASSGALCQLGVGLPSSFTIRLSMMNASFRCVLLALALGAPTAAQGLDLGKLGGALPGSTQFPLQGSSNAPYLLLMSTVEQSTPLPGLGITLDISDDLVDLCINLPGFLGMLDGAGRGTPSLALPDIPALAGLVLSFQAISGAGTYVVSNLVRVTPQRRGTFEPALGQPALPIAGGSFATAADGELFFAGGTGPLAQRYSSRTEEWELAGASFGVGLFSQTTALTDGRLLFSGGLGLDGQPTAAAAVYDPSTQRTLSLNMAIPRAGHGASLMGDGRVLVTGGFETVSLTDPLALFAGIRASTEIFDPTTGAFSTGPNMLEARALHASSTLADGQVLITGGLTLLPIVNIPTVSPTAYRFNPSSGSFGLPSLMNGGRFMHSSVGLSNGRVLLAGGLTVDFSVFLQTGSILDIIIGTRTDCQVYRSTFLGMGTFTTVDGMQEGRAGAAIAALPNGGALIAGGFNLVIDIPSATFRATATASADLFAQGPYGIAPTGSMAAPRLFPLAANLPDGTVLVVGGGPTGVEIFQH